MYWDPPLELELKLENCLFEKYKYNHTTNLARKSGKKHNIIELYKYSQETEAKVQEYRYHQSHLLGHAVSWVDHRKRRWVLLVLVCYVRIKVHM